MDALLPVALVVIFVCLTLNKKNKNGKTGWQELRNATKSGMELREASKTGVERIASDGHKISAEDDISCARFGHDHANDPKQEGFPENQFIVHNEPPAGYINLNGKILKRSEADEYIRKHG